MQLLDRCPAELALRRSTYAAKVNEPTVAAGGVSASPLRDRTIVRYLADDLKQRRARGASSDGWALTPRSDIAGLVRVNSASTVSALLPPTLDVTLVRRRGDNWSASTVDTCGDRLPARRIMPEPVKYGVTTPNAPWPLLG